MAALSSFLFLFIILSSLLLIDAQVPGDLRLIRNGRSSTGYYYGRLQIYVSGRWGEVCADNFNITERNVACHQLGYSSSLNNDTINSYGDDVGAVSISEVSCYGNSEYLHLLRCSYKKGFHNCQRNFVTLYCNTTNNTPYNGQLRLLYGTTSSNGLVQVYCNGQWGTVCGRYFSPDAAHLVCRQLGYTSAKSYANGTMRGSYNTPIFLDNLYCSATPTDVCLGSCTSCTGSTVSSSSCYHSYDLNVHCVYEALHYEEGSNTTSCESIELRPRLGEVRQLPTVGSSSVSVVQVSYGEGNDTLNKEWLSVCGSTPFDVFNAMTLCKQLGYDQLNNYTLISTGYSRQFNANCTSEQPHILWCPREVTYCNQSLSVNCSYSTANYYTGQVRLVDGEYPSEGRLEIYIRGSWGSVSAYSNYESYKTPADNACRQLGYTGAAAVSIGTIPGSGTVWYRISSSYRYYYSSSYTDYYNCNSYYPNCFSRCVRYTTPYPDYTYYYETHYNDIAINCTFDVNSVMRVGSSTSCEIYVSPSPTNDSGPHTGAIVGGVFGSVLFIIILLIIIISVIVVCRIKRLNKKNSQQRRPEAVSYAAQRQQVGFVPQAGYAIPPGTVLVPVAPGPMGMVPVNAVPQFVPAPVNNTGEEDERKEEPPATEEVSPLPLIPPVTD